MLGMLNRKYNIQDLYVIKECKNGVTRFYIATFSYDGVYVEVLNGKRLNVDNKENIEPLTRYYSSSEAYNYTVWTPLSRDELFKKTIQISTDYAIAQYEKEQFRILDQTLMISDLVEKLNEATMELFSRNGKLRLSDFGKSDTSLIQHLRDDEWLAKRLQNSSIEFKDVFFGTIYTYVKTSPLFQKQRYGYEQRIIKHQIEGFVGLGVAWDNFSNIFADSTYFYENYDICFRLAIDKILKGAEMDSEAIEEGFEVNSGVWRDSCMRIAFKNIYEPNLVFVDEGLTRMEPVCEEFKNAWLRMRMYEYYQAHKDSVDKYGEVTPEMQMSEEEVESLRRYLAQMHAERMAYIEEFRNSKSAELPKKLIMTLND